MSVEKTDLDHSAKLMEALTALDSDPASKEKWDKKLKDHYKQCMDKHVTAFKNLRAKSAGEGWERLERLRARLSFNEVVMERLHEKIASSDPELAKVMKDLQEKIRESADEAVVPPVNGYGSGGGGNSTRGGGRQQPSGGNSLGDTMNSSMNATLLISPGAPAAFSEGLLKGSPTSPGFQSTFQSTGFRSPGSPNFQGTGGLGGGGQQPVRSYVEIHQHLDRSQRVAGASMGVGRPGAGKELNLRQLRDIMKTVYESKEESDARGDENEGSGHVETMEQHLYSFLSKRYGLKSVVEEWARAIFKAIMTHASKEADVAAFGKVLQNKLPENIYTVHLEVKRTISNYLKEQILERDMAKENAAVEWRSWQQNGVPLDACEETLMYMYVDKHKEEVLKSLPVMKNDKVKLRDLHQACLEFQTKLAEDYLKDFLVSFNEVDDDHDGVITHDQFEDLKKRVLQDETAHVIDSPGTSVTFSQCVDMFREVLAPRRSADEAAEDHAALEGGFALGGGDAALEGGF